MRAWVAVGERRARDSVVGNLVNDGLRVAALVQLESSPS